MNSNPFPMVLGTQKREATPGMREHGTSLSLFTTHHTVPFGIDPEKRVSFLTLFKSTVRS